ncbi:MAG: aspartate-semialdehyde dehydrogenase [Deltaproteobacteria bacterium]|nr:aspartate-semialdehyde dehydrogenase [Deltaproteobacteria bacterium]
MTFSHVGKINSVAMVGATGLVGREFLDLLHQHRMRIPRIKLYASEESSGQSVDLYEAQADVDELTSDSFDDIEVAFFSVPADISRKYIPYAVNAGTLVVDDSHAFRMQNDVPLVIPQVNGQLLRDFDGPIIATPNCTVTPLALCLKPLHDRYTVNRVVVSTYQSASGAGRRTYEELSKQTISLMNGMSVDSDFPHRFAFNCIPQIGGTQEDGSSEEEEKIVLETKKILEAPEMKISATAVRVPTFCGHGLSVNIEMEKTFENLETVREILDNFPGLKVLDNPTANIYPTNVECIGSDCTLVGRIRRDFSVPSGINLWIITDNLRKGAALNALEIIETLYSYRAMA